MSHKQEQTRKDHHPNMLLHAHLVADVVRDRLRRGRVEANGGAHGLELGFEGAHAVGVVDVPRGEEPEPVQVLKQVPRVGVPANGKNKQGEARYRGSTSRF